MGHVGATLPQLVFGAGEFFETAEAVRGFRYAGVGLVAVALAICGNALLFATDNNHSAAARRLGLSRGGCSR